MKQNGIALEYASEELKGDRAFILEAVKQNGKALRYAEEELKSDKEFVMAAVNHNRSSFNYAAIELQIELQNDEKFIEKVNQNEDYFLYRTYGKSGNEA